MLLAKRVGVKDFSIKMGPSIVGQTIGQTLYSLRWPPVGGYVKPTVMDDPNEPVTNLRKGY